MRRLAAFLGVVLSGALVCEYGSAAGSLAVSGFRTPSGSAFWEFVILR